MVQLVGECGENVSDEGCTLEDGTLINLSERFRI